MVGGTKGGEGTYTFNVSSIYVVEPLNNSYLYTLRHIYSEFAFCGALYNKLSKSLNDLETMQYFDSIKKALEKVSRWGYKNKKEIGTLKNVTFYLEPCKGNWVLRKLIDQMAKCLGKRPEDYLTRETRSVHR